MILKIVEYFLFPDGREEKISTVIYPSCGWNSFREFHAHYKAKKSKKERYDFIENGIIVTGIYPTVGDIKIKQIVTVEEGP